MMEENELRLIIDNRMFQLINKLKKNGTIRFQQDFNRVINIERQTINKIQKGTQHFTIAHVYRAAVTYNVPIAWFMKLKQ